MSTLSLAYIGDGIYELLARTHILALRPGKACSMHEDAIQLVSAAAQAKAARALLPQLCGEERDVFLRGRNAKPKSVPKNAQCADYAYATALEALFGMLFCEGQKERIVKLWNFVLKTLEHDPAEKAAL